MAIQNTLSKPPEKKHTFSTFLTSGAIKAKVNSMISGKDGDRFITALISAVSNNPALSECEHSTILSAAMLGEALKLTPSPQLGQYYLVPFNDKKRGCKVAQFQLGYKGYIQLAIRSGYYKRLNVVAIKDGELKKYDRITEEIELTPIINEIDWENAQTIGYFAFFEYQNGFRKGMYWPIEKMEIHADKYSQAFNLEVYRKIKAGEIPKTDLWKYSSFWYKDFDAMAFKTMLRQLISKWGIMSVEMQNAINNDMAVINENGEPEYVDNIDDAKPIESKIVELESNPSTGTQQTVKQGDKTNGPVNDPLSFAD